MNKPKMSRQQAITLWNSLTPQQKDQFNKMLEKMGKGELKLEEINVNENNQIKNILIKDRDKPSKPDKPFYKHFSSNCGD